MRLISPLIGGAAVWLAATTPLAAQAQSNGRPPVDMQAVAAALGVTCEYCHADRQASSASGRPRFEVAREMIAMTAEINARVQAATGRAEAGGVRVECVTCHRGVTIPRQLRDIMLQATVQQGPAAAVALYRDLRQRYHGRQSYDFGEETLVTVAEGLAQGRPDAAIALADLNIEFYPRSVRSYLTKGIALSRRLDTVEEAVATFRKALEIEPDNGVIKGWLLQTEPLTRRVR